MKNLTFRKTDKSHISVHNAEKKLDSTYFVYQMANRNTVAA